MITFLVHLDKRWFCKQMLRVTSKYCSYLGGNLWYVDIFINQCLYRIHQVYIPNITGAPCYVAYTLHPFNIKTMFQDTILCWSWHLLIFIMWSSIQLQWRHNERDGVSNHRHIDCLLNSLFRCRIKKTSKAWVTVFSENPPEYSPHKGPVKRKMFPFADVIMVIVYRNSNQKHTTITQHCYLWNWNFDYLFVSILKIIDRDALMCHVATTTNSCDLQTRVYLI